MWEAVGHVGIEPHVGQQLPDACTPASSVEVRLEQPKWPLDDRPNGVPRIQRGVRILKDELDCSPQRARPVHRAIREWCAIEKDDACVGPVKSGDCPQER